ncbi:MAG: TetR/AcrR family transcriptional regulator, partial [Nocardioides sp.]|nr:TetR/AcrR family transcriptional regulator [Nocardioides sp.]
RLVDGVSDTVIALRDNELFRRIVDVDPEMLLPYLLDRRGRSQDAIIAILRDRIAQGQRDGAVRDGDPLLLARSLLLLAHGQALSVHTMTDDTITTGDLDQEFRTVLRRALQP